MPNINSRTKPQTTRPAPKRPDPCEDTRPACPVCGGLKCLCRPRFFPGQLLSEEDLNRLQQYVIDKSRLHNRHLVGWGVACGLEVSCNPCDDGAVTISEGYALAPCGDDIVVCTDQQVDICALIQSCRPVRDPICDPPYQRPASACIAETERWVIAVCYDEKPMRGISALTGAGDRVASPGCRCGGSSACTCSNTGASCSCGASSSGARCNCGSTSSAYQAVNKRRTVLPQCEPTQICEGFRFTAYKAPVKATGFDLPSPENGSSPSGTDATIAWLYANRSKFGPMLERALCCMLKALELRAAILEGQSPANGLSVYRDYAHALQDFAADFAVHQCSLLSETRRLYESAVEWTGTRVDGQLSSTESVDLGTRLAQLDRVWMNIATECMCSALLPSCPGPVNSNCVPLGVVTVRTKGEKCEVIHVCNWQERKLLITWPTIQYWLSWLPWHRIREAIARICCGGDKQEESYSAMALLIGLAYTSASSSKYQTTGAGLSARFSAEDLQPEATPSMTYLAAMQSPSLMQHMIGDFEKARSGSVGTPPIMALAARLFDGRALAPLAGSDAVREIDLSDVRRDIGVDSLQEQIGALQKTVQKQEELLRALKIVNDQ